MIFILAMGGPVEKQELFLQEVPVKTVAKLKKLSARYKIDHLKAHTKCAKAEVDEESYIYCNSLHHRSK